MVFGGCRGQWFCVPLPFYIAWGPFKNRCSRLIPFSEISFNWSGVGLSRLSICIRMCVCTCKCVCADVRIGICLCMCVHGLNWVCSPMMILVCSWGQEWLNRTHNLPSNNRGSVHFSSVAQSCLTLCDPMDFSTSGFPVHYHLLEFTQTHVH